MEVETQKISCSVLSFFFFFPLNILALICLFHLVKSTESVESWLLSCDQPAND